MSSSNWRAVFSLHVPITEENNRIRVKYEVTEMKNHLDPSNNFFIKTTPFRDYVHCKADKFSTVSPWGLLKELGLIDTTE